MQRPLEHHLVVPEELAVVGRHDHERVVGDATLVEHREDATDLVVDLADHAEVAGGDARELLT